MVVGPLDLCVGHSRVTSAEIYPFFRSDVVSDKAANPFTAADNCVLDDTFGIALVVGGKPAVKNHGCECRPCTGQQDGTGRLSLRLWLRPGTASQNRRKGDKQNRCDHSQRINVALLSWSHGKPPGYS